MTEILDLDKIRRSIRESLPDIEPASASDARVRSTYVPPSHVKALDMDNTLVEGIRGAGKTFWTQALASTEHREYLEKIFPETQIKAATLISVGFSAKSDVQNYPDKDTLSDIVKKTQKPRHIWRAVIATHLGFPAPFPREGKWLEKVEWVRDHPEDFQRFLQDEDHRISSKGQSHLVLFDALDRLADDWPGIRVLAKTLFQVALEMRSLQAVRFKMFVRPDMLDDSEIRAFPDASKLLGRKVSLEWRRADLYALLFQCLANDPDGWGEFRTLTLKDDVRWDEKTFQSEYRSLPRELRSNEDLQKRVFHSLAGPAMGPGSSGYKRGYPYTWLPNHLLDGQGQVSPRSFCAALHTAADPDNVPQEWAHALHYKGIHAGVQAASQIRKNEISEDYPWVPAVMEPLQGNLIPCAFEDMKRLWDSNRTLENLRSRIQSSDGIKLPPQHLQDGHEGLLNDMRSLGIVQVLTDGRIQMPDVYRIAFGLGRKGGVRPLR